MSKFTQAELEKAYKQMQEEREQERNLAKKAAGWVKEKLKLGGVHVNYNGSYKEVSPYKRKFVLVCVYETYGPYLEDYVNALGSVKWAVSDGTVNCGHKPDLPVFNVKTPYGDYKLTFEYFDNHYAGY